MARLTLPTTQNQRRFGLAYPNFNYQGTDVTETDLSGMGYLHVDIWVATGTARMVKFPQSITGRGPRNPWLKYQLHRAHGIVLTCLNLPLQDDLGQRLPDEV